MKMRLSTQENFRVYLCGCSYNYWGAEQIRVCVSRYDQSAQKRRQKVFTRGALRLCREA